MSVEVAPHKLADLLLTGGVQVLELVQVPLHVEAVRGDEVRLPLDEVCGLHSSDLGDGREDMSQVRGGALDTVAVVDTSLPSLRVTVKILQVVVEVRVPRTQVSGRGTREMGDIRGGDEGRVQN